MPIERVGLIGAGTVGQRFIGFLLEDDYDVVVFDIDDAALEAAREQGAATGESAADVARQVDLVVLSLPGKPYVEAAMEGPDGVLEGLSEGQVVVDTGTTPPDVDVRHEELCEERGAGHVDAGMTGGGPGPRYTMFVGGKEEHYEFARPVIECLSSQHGYFGSAGHGHVVKAGHRMWQNLRANTDAEVVEYFRNNGIDPEQVDSLLELDLRDALYEEEYTSAGGFERAVDGDPYDPVGGDYRVDDTGAMTRLRTSDWTKDPTYALRVAQSTNSYTPLLMASVQVQLAAENIGGALLERPIGYKDTEWPDRTSYQAVYRSLNRPAEEWASLSEQAESE